MSVEEQAVRFTNLDKVLYPATGTTKGQVIDYYRVVSGVLLPGLAGRPVTGKRWPNGVDGAPFFIKDLDSGTPDWVPNATILHSDGPKRYPLIDSTAALLQMAQMAALELHVPQWRIDDPGQRPAGRRATRRPDRAVRYPDRVVLDLDPGPGAGLPECVQVALAIRDRLGDLGHASIPVTSGSKGLHLYVPMAAPITSDQASDWAQQIAQQMQQQFPDLVVWRMTRAIRAGKVFLDWSQNNASKTTIAPYSLRGRDHPMVAAPRVWEELEAPDLAHLDYRQVLDRAEAGLDPMTDPHQLLPRSTKDSHRLKTTMVEGEPPPAAPTPVAGAPRAPAARPATLPDPIAPMLARSGSLATLSTSAALVLEGKWDGIRVVAQIGGDAVVLRSRTGRDITAGYPELADLPQVLGGHQVVLDGEIVAMDESGRTDFGRLQQRMGLSKPGDIDKIRRTVPVAYLIFDVLLLDGQSLLTRPLTERRQILEDLQIAGTFVIVPPQLRGDPAPALAQTKADGWEGIIAKRADSTYQPGARTKAWTKVKNLLMQQAVIIGWDAGQGRRADTIGALLLAVPDEDGLRYIGRVGTGFTDKMLDQLATQLAPLRQGTPAAAVPRADARTAVWVRPEIVGEVVYSEMTHHGTLRHPSWRGLRPDKTPATITPVKR